MSDCTQFIHEARYQIEALLKAGHRQSGIATVLKQHKSMISREVRATTVFMAAAPSRRTHDDDC